MLKRGGSWEKGSSSFRTATRSNNLDETMLKFELHYSKGSGTRVTAAGVMPLYGMLY